ncbi:MAG: hypothetical protein OHK0022_22700 [Roseiflexaceae bacterium]
MEVRTLAAATGWLDGRLRWRDGRVAWEWRDTLLTPGPTELTQAQHRLGKIAYYRFATDQVFGDGRAWLAQRYARLDLAQRLSTLHAPDLEGLARARGPEAARRLTALLEAEALCLDRLPASPAAALLGLGADARAPLSTLIADSHAPAPARALAALVIGALRLEHAEQVSEDGEHQSAQFAFLNEPFLRRAFVWARRTGLPEQPALIATLLTLPRGQFLAGCMVQALRDGQTFGLPVAILRELLADGIPGERVVALAEAAAAIEPLAARIGPPSQHQRDRPSHRRDWDRLRQAASERRQTKQSQIATLRTLIHDYARATCDPAVIEQIAVFVEALRAITLVQPANFEMIERVLREGQDLSPALQRPWLDLLAEHHSLIWPAGSRPKDERRSEMPFWLQHRWKIHGWRILQILKGSRDPQLTREMIALNMYPHIGDYRWTEPERYRLAVTLQRAFDPANDYDLTGSLAGVLTRFPTIAPARSVFQPLIETLGGLPLAQRGPLCSTLLDRIDGMSRPPREALAALARHAPRIVQIVRRTNRELNGEWLMPALLLLDQIVPNEAMDWIERAISMLDELSRQSNSSVSSAWMVRIGVQLAAIAAEGSLVRFEILLRTFFLHDFDVRLPLLESGIDALQRLPLLRPVIGRLFPQQPQRCADLLVQVGRAAKLGPNALAPIQELHGAALDGPAGMDLCLDWLERCGAALEIPSGWRELLDQAPELLPTATAYLYARWLLDQPADLPPGVRRALDLPRKLAGELAYIERTLTAQPERADLAARAGSLRERLADQERLRGLIRTEASERLAQIAAETHLTAAERQVQNCFRVRLAAIAGLLPPDLTFDDDLLNATMLSVDITYNRKLLRRLLRAAINGDHDWRERHPANAAFLQQLAAQGVDVQHWLGEHPQTVRCPVVPGGRVRLYLERDPIRVLQMGNHVNTCLSLGAINAFATVANACELNKRVIYATDSNGRVVARQLIGISENWTLLGFHTYVTLDNEEAVNTLREIIERYTMAFAARCGLTLGDKGDVLRLFAEEWYDDGVQPWNAPAVQQTKQREPNAER